MPLLFTQQPRKDKPGDKHADKERFRYHGGCKHCYQNFWATISIRKNGYLIQHRKCTAFPENKSESGCTRTLDAYGNFSGNCTKKDECGGECFNTHGVIVLNVAQYAKLIRKQNNLASSTTWSSNREEFLRKIDNSPETTPNQNKPKSI